MATVSFSRGLLWKELRGQAPVTLSVCLFVLALTARTWSQVTTLDIPWPSTTTLVELIAVAAAAIFGTLSWGAESLEKTRSFLLSLPVPRKALWQAKALAAAFSLTTIFLLGMGGMAIFSMGGAPWPSIPRLLGWMLLSAVTWTVFSRLSLVFRDPLITLVVGFPGFLLGPLVLMESFAPIAGRQWIEPGRGPATWVYLCVVGLVGWSLHRAVDRLEDRPQGLSLELGLKLFSTDWLKTRSPLTQLRRKLGIQVGTVVLLVLATVVCAWMPAAALVVFPWAGAILGSRLFTPEERDGMGFFLHHLPVSRRNWVIKRSVLGLATGGALLAMLWVLLGFFPDRFGPQLPLESPDIWSFFYLLTVSYGLAFGFGAMLSPWLPGGLIGSLLALMTLAFLTFIPATFRTDPPGQPFDVALLIIVWALAYWSTVHSRALEPRPNKLLRVLGLLAPFWLLAGAALWL